MRRAPLASAAALLLTAAAPLTLYTPPQGDFSTTAPATGCGDLSKPCQSTLGTTSLGYTPYAGPGWTAGGSLSAAVGGASGARGAATAVAGQVWARSPDGQWTLSLGIAHETTPAWTWRGASGVQRALPSALPLGSATPDPHQ